MNDETPFYEIVEDNWAPGKTEFYITKDGRRMASFISTANSFLTLEAAIEQLNKMKFFKPTKKVVYTDSF